MALSTRYLTMRDGVRIAIDVHRPDGVRQPVPTILHQTRYMRSVRWRGPLSRLGIERYIDGVHATRQRFLAEGYAWVDVDTRGSGASTGTRPCPWWRDEVDDGARVVDFIVAQPWSNRRVGATGVSYAGTCAEMLLINQHPAVKAVIPRFSLYDVYADVAFPGGIHLSWFTREWSRFNRDLDENRYHRAMARMLQQNLYSASDLYDVRQRPLIASLLRRVTGSDRFRHILSQLLAPTIAGVTPVANAASVLDHAVIAHRANVDVHRGAESIVCRDDSGAMFGLPEETIDSFSPHAYRSRIIGSGTALLSYSGWLDAAYCHSAVKRFVNGDSARSWLILGPWDHGGRQQISPHHPDHRASFDHNGELVRFMDGFLRTPVEGVSMPRVRYYTMGEERWRSADTWPPAHVVEQTWYLASRRTLRAQPQADAGADRYRVDAQLGSGARSRWRSLLGTKVPLGYGDRRRLADRMLTYTGPPLERDTIVTGHPIVHLFVRADAEDGAVFAYLDDVAPTGRVTYVTEGQLRILHRNSGSPPYRSPGVARAFTREHAQVLEVGRIAELHFDLLPTSYQFRAGHAFRLSISCADNDHFAAIFVTDQSIEMRYGGPYPARLRLPVER